MPPFVDHEQSEITPELKPYYENKLLFYSNVFWLMFGNMVLLAGQVTVGSLMAMHMANIKLDAAQISTVLAAGSCVGIPVYLYFSYLTDNWQWRWGRRLPFVAFSLPIMLLGLLPFSHIQTLAACYIFYIIFVIALQIKAISYPLLINDTCKKKYWGRVSGVMLLAGNAGIWLGQTKLLPLVDTRGENFVYWIIAVTITIATSLTLLFVKEPHVRSSSLPKFNPVQVMWATLKLGFADKRNIPVFIAYAFCGSALLPLQMVVLQAKVNLGLSAGDVGIKILQYGTIAMSVTAFFTGWAIDKLGVIRAVGIGVFIALFATLLGFNPVLISQWSQTFNLNFPVTSVLACAYVLISVAYNQMFTSACIFVMGRVPREQVAIFCACSGTVSLVFQAFTMLCTGRIITWFFDGNYGISFIVALILSFSGFLMLYMMNASDKKVRDKNLEEITVTAI